MHDHETASALNADLILALPFALALILYLSGIVIQARRGCPWPWYRSLAWVIGIGAALSGFIGPLAAAAHNDFVAHMWAHLLVGMVAPLFLVSAAPVTLALRSMHVTRARRLSRLLRSWPVRFLTTPIVAATLSIGGMWLLYSSTVYQAMGTSAFLHALVMTHFLLSGCLFVAALIPVDPAPHRASYPLRMGVLVAALAAHNILAKMIYATPPAGVNIDQAHAGAMLMYYAGDLIDIVIITILCARWYRDAGRDLRRAPSGHTVRSP
ncbi:cytochrome c oxidase assembly protein [Leifsonia sp. A12D58]|uniref:cytochrome c oxidase assembly protein n=1 Tax=Leifsonia sp. A12D58 TaxID=3397674 RepID=UPI0039E1EB87